jgi:hypothetical protein
LKFLDAILLIQPGNHQAKNLKDEVTRRMNREGCMLIYFGFLYKTTIFIVYLDVGMGIAVGAGALLVGGKKIKYAFLVLSLPLI